MMPTELSTTLPLWAVSALAVISFLVGILGGFVGLALGTIRLPALLLIGVSPSVAAGTNILVSMLSTVVGGIRHARDRRVSWRVVAFMSAPAALGSFIGGLGGSYALPEGALILAAGLFVCWQSIEFLARLRPAHPGSAARESGGEPGVRTGLVEGAAGLVVGLVGGAVGLILGSVRLPVIIRVSGEDPRRAAGSNLVIGFFMGAAGFAGHGIRGEIDPVLLLVMGPSAMAGSYVGARLTGRADIRTLMLTMSVVLLVVGILLARDGASRLIA